MACYRALLAGPGHCWARLWLGRRREPARCQIPHHLHARPLRKPDRGIARPVGHNCRSGTRCRRLEPGQVPLFPASAKKGADFLIRMCVVGPLSLWNGDHRPCSSATPSRTERRAEPMSDVSVQGQRTGINESKMSRPAPRRRARPDFAIMVHAVNMPGRSSMHLAPGPAAPLKATTRPARRARR
jgi:hypothetical protein